LHYFFPAFTNFGIESIVPAGSNKKERQLPMAKLERNILPLANRLTFWTHKKEEYLA